MKRLTSIAAALAAAMTTFAAQAQEQPASLGQKELREAFAAVRNAEKPAASGKTEVDRTTTASISKPAPVARAARPKLAAKGRKSVVLKSVAQVKEEEAGGEAVALAGALGEAKGSYSAIITRYAASYGVPVTLAHAVVRIESNFRPDARGSAGEVGLMQIKPATARMMGYSGSTAGLFNPETNIKFGMKYLAMAQKLGGGSTCGTVLKYNAGHAATRMNRVSAAYCAKVKMHIGS